MTPLNTIQMKKKVRGERAYKKLLLLLPLIAVFAVLSYFYSISGFLQEGSIDEKDLKWWNYTEAGGIKGTEPIEIQGAKNCWLLVHGYGSTPTEFSYIAPALHNATGATISVPLLKGHGTKASELQKTEWKDWYEDVAREYAKLEEECTTINAAGSSLGATILVQLSREKKISTLVLLAPFTEAKRKIDQWLVNNAAGILHYVKKKRIGSINDPSGQKMHKTYWNFPIMPLQKSRKEIEKAGEITPQAAKLIVIISNNDTVTDNAQARKYYERFKGEKKIIELNTSDHVMSLDFEKEKVAEEMARRT